MNTIWTPWGPADPGKTALSDVSAGKSTDTAGAGALRRLGQHQRGWSEPPASSPSTELTVSTEDPDEDGRV